MTPEERDARIWLGLPFRPDSKRADEGLPKWCRKYVPVNQERPPRAWRRILHAVRPRGVLASTGPQPAPSAKAAFRP